MATYSQRAVAYAEALLGKAPTNAQVNRLGRAWAERVGKQAEYMAGSNEEKAKILVQAALDFNLQVVKGYEAELAVGVARAQAAATVDTDFPETTP
jgi:hypothetical protein